MAEEEIQEEAPKGGKKKLILIILGVVLLIGATVGGTLFATGFFEEKPISVEEQEKLANAAPEKDEPSYVVINGIKPEMTINLPRGSGANFLLIEVTALTFYDDVYKVIKKHMPKLRNTANLVVSSFDATLLRTRQGRDDMQKQLKNALQNDVKGYLEHEEMVIDQVYFSRFLMQ